MEFSGVKSGVFPCLDNIEYNSRIGFGCSGQTGQGFEGFLTGRKKTRNLLSVEFNKYRVIFTDRPEGKLHVLSY